MQNFTLNPKYKLFISFLIFFIIIAFFGIPFSDWWFTGDDFHGIFLGYKTKTWQDLLYFFYEGHTNQGVGNPGGYITTRAGFLDVYYRPFYCVFLALQYWLFGVNGYGYFLCNIGMHALAASLIFYLFSSYTSIWTALVGAGLFAFHPQIAYRFGSIVNFHYYVNTVLILCIALAIKNFIKTRNFNYVILCQFLYLFSLGTRETTLVLPAIIFLFLGSYKIGLADLSLSWKEIFKISFLFGITALAYIGLRLWLYPLQKIATNGILLSTLKSDSFVSLKFQEFLVFFYDALFLSWLPWGNKVLKIALIGPLLTLLVVAFLKNKQKIMTASLFLCGVMMIWPGIISFYSPRYMYESIIYFIAGFIIFFTASSIPTSLKRAIKISCSSFIFFLAAFTFQSFQAREKKLNHMHTAVNGLCQKLKGETRPLCFLTTPVDGFAGGYNPQIFWIILNNRDYPIYFDSALAINQLDANIVKPGRWINTIAPYYDENYITIEPTQDGFVLESLNENKIVFDGYQQNRQNSIGHIQILKKTIDNIPSKIHLAVHPHLLNDEPVFINWNYETKRFDILENYFNAT